MSLRSCFIRIPLNVSYSPCFDILRYTKNMEAFQSTQILSLNPLTLRIPIEDVSKKWAPIDGWFVKARLELFRCLLLQGFLRKQIGRWLPKVPSKMMPTEKTPKLQFLETAWEVYILSTSGRCFDMNTSSSTALPAFWGKDLPSFSKVFSHKNSDQIFRLCRPLRHLEAPSVLPLPSIAHRPRLFSPHPTDPWPGRFHATSLRGFWGGWLRGYPRNLRHVKVVRGKKSMGNVWKFVCVFSEYVKIFVGWISLPPQKKVHSSRVFFPLDVTLLVTDSTTALHGTPRLHGTVVGHLLLEGL